MTEHPEWVDDLRPCDSAGFVCHGREDFVGREWLFDEIDAWRTDGDEPVLLVKGDPGMGKSALLAELAHANPGGRVLAYHFCRADTLKTLRPGRFVQSLAAILARRLELYAAKLEDPALGEALGRSQCEADPGIAFEKGVLAPLKALPAPEAGACYFLVDALDEALAPQGALVPTTIVDVLESRLDRLPPWVRILATTRDEGTTLRQLRGLRARQIDVNDPRGLGDVRRYVAARLNDADLAKRVAAGNLSREQVAKILEEKSGGNFLYVEQALDGLRRGQYGLEDLEALPAGLGGLYRALFDHCFPDEASFAPASRVLEVVTAAPEPLSADQLAAATGMDDRAEFAAVLETLSVPLVRRGEPGGPARYAVFHESLADWLTNPEQAGAVHHVGAKRGHERLADTGGNEYREGLGAMSPYAIEHLPGHLIAAERWDELEELLTDFAYLEAKTEAGLVFALARDFTTAVNSMPADCPGRRTLRVLEEALYRDAGFIAGDPTTLFQCLWNSAWWHDCPESIGHYDFPDGALASPTAPKEASGRKVHELLQAWRAAKEAERPGFPWVRSLRPPPAEAGGSKQAVLRGHERGVLAVAYCPDAKRILSGSLDETVRVWDAETGDEVLCLRGHERGVRSVAFSPDRGWIISGSMDQTVRLWDAVSGTELRCLSGHARDVTSVACCPDGRQILSGSLDQTVRLWDSETGAEVRCFRG
ncbi:MAG: WD40 repeat domain-containing protein, partial [Planctomycetota bacterium]